MNWLQRLFKREGKEHGRFDPFVGDVMRPAQAVGDKFLRQIHLG